MKKFCLSFTVASTILLMVSLCFAQVPRGQISSEGKTGYTNLSVVGLDKDGANAAAQPGLPGYIEMISTSGSVFYLYIGFDGDLRLASEQVIGTGASPTTIGWADASGTVVGTQS